MIILLIVLGSILGYFGIGYGAATLSIPYAYRHSEYGPLAARYLKIENPDGWDRQYIKEYTRVYKNEMRTSFLKTLWLWWWIVPYRFAAVGVKFLKNHVDNSIDATIKKVDPVVKQVKVKEIERERDAIAEKCAVLEADLLEKNRLPDVLDELDAL
jgi:hypothetical protein